jgi:hypothetical protein
VNWTHELHLSEEETKRVRAIVFSLGTSYAEFVRIAVLQACDEVEGIARASQ